MESRWDFCVKCAKRKSDLTFPLWYGDEYHIGPRLQNELPAKQEDASEQNNLHAYQTSF